VVAKLQGFRDDPELLMLMTMLYQLADLTSLGYSSTGITKENREKAFTRLLSLEPHSLRFFVPVAVPKELGAAMPGVGAESSNKELNICLDALHLNLGSGDGFRHLKHGCESKKASPLIKMLRNEKDDQEKLKKI